MRLYVREWDFDLEEIAFPLHLFHSEQDPQVPVALVRRMMRSLPGTRLITYPEDGHLSTFTNHIGEIAEALTRDRFSGSGRQAAGVQPEKETNNGTSVCPADNGAGSLAGKTGNFSGT
jgi:hypothetical protein